VRSYLPVASTAERWPVASFISAQEENGSNSHQRSIRALVSSHQGGLKSISICASIWPVSLSIRRWKVLILSSDIDWWPSFYKIDWSNGSGLSVEQLRCREKGAGVTDEKAVKVLVAKRTSLTAPRLGSSLVARRYVPESCSVASLAVRSERLRNSCRPQTPTSLSGLHRTCGAPEASDCAPLPDRHKTG